MPQPFNLTLGVELEFICVFPQGAFNGQEPDLVPTEEELDGQIAAGHALQHFLLAANIPATGWEELGTVPPDVAEYSSWSVNTDCLDLSADESCYIPDGYFMEPIEISSRIFSLFQDDWRGEIRAVMNVLAVMKNRFGCEFLTNETTGFHVHIGNDGGQPMPFDTVKRVFQLATAHERVIDSMQASSRVLAPRPGTDDDRFLYAPLSFFHRLEDASLHLNANNVFDWLKRIEMMQSFEDFSSFFSREYRERALSGHCSAVNFDNLWSETFEDLTNTIEFRQHVGTLDYAEIVAWVTFLSQLTFFCHGASDEHVIALALRATDTDFTAADLLRVVGCDDDIVQHYDFDGEGLIIGMLPQAGNDILTDSHLLDLNAQNDDEVTDNTDRRQVQRLINQKLSICYYGFDSALGLLPLAEQMIHDMLQRAYGKVSQHTYVICDLQFPGGMSQARSVVFGILSFMHRSYDPTIGPMQPAIADGIRHLTA